MNEQIPFYDHTKNTTHIFLHSYNILHRTNKKKEHPFFCFFLKKIENEVIKCSDTNVQNYIHATEYGADRAHDWVRLVLSETGIGDEAV